MHSEWRNWRGKKADPDMSCLVYLHARYHHCNITVRELLFYKYTCHALRNCLWWKGSYHKGIWI